MNTSAALITIAQITVGQNGGTPNGDESYRCAHGAQANRVSLQSMTGGNQMSDQAKGSPASCAFAFNQGIVALTRAETVG